MSSNIVLSFAMLFASVIALICAVYVYLGNKKKYNQSVEQEQTIEEE